MQEKTGNTAVTEKGEKNHEKEAYLRDSRTAFGAADRGRFRVSRCADIPAGTRGEGLPERKRLRGVEVLRRLRPRAGRQRRHARSVHPGAD